MKNTKREITLNERDSLKDMLETEKGLMRACLEGLWIAEKREVRERILSHIAAVSEQVFFISDLLQNVEGN